MKKSKVIFRWISHNKFEHILSRNFDPSKPKILEVNLVEAEVWEINRVFYKLIMI